MTVRLSVDKDPFACGDAGFALADAESPSTEDWVAEAARSGGAFELYLDEITGLYEVRRLDGPPPLGADGLHAALAGSMEFAPQLPEAPQPTSPPLATKAADAALWGRTDAKEEPLIAWASFAGAAGQSAFHSRLGWALGVIGAADFSPLPALDQSRGGSAWPLDAAA